MDDGEDVRIDDRLESATLQTTREELKATFEYQVQRLREIDSKAIEILKANLLLIGIVVTGGSVLVQTELEVGVFINPFTLTGGFLLLVSTGLASVTYTASNLRGGLGHDAVEAAIESADGSDSQDDSAFERRLLRSYARWIDYNARVIAVNDILVTVTVLFVFVAFVYVVAGVVAAAVSPSPTTTAIGFTALTVVMALFTWLAYHMDHLGTDSDVQTDTFRGVRLSKGTSRRQGLSTLLEMLGRSPQKYGEQE